MFKYCLILLVSCVAAVSAAAQDILVEAESFANKGGWSVDQQFMEQMGSPYLIAHGMGCPVADADTEVAVEQAGKYDVYVRTYNWTAPWTSKSGPGKFTLTVGNTKLKTVLGTTGNAWEWQKAGTVNLKKGTTSIRLHDLTGFDGRCDAVLLTTDAQSALAKLAGNGSWEVRRMMAGKSAKPAKEASYDLVVVGGGIAGMCAASAAARLGCKVALVNDRPVLGGNNSQEIRVHLGGISETGLYPSIGRMIREFGHSRSGNAMPADYYEDAKKDSFINAEKNVTLYAPYHALAVNKQGSKISSVVIEETSTGHRIVLSAPLFSDCTGDGTIGYLAGADYKMGREAKSEFNESIAPDVADNMVMGASIQWYAKNEPKTTKFPEFSYGVEFNETNCERVTKGEWKWETGLYRDQVAEAELVRDYGLMVIYSNWSYLKNHSGDKKFRNKSLDWVGYVAGKRESRRLMGDYVVSQQDIEKDVYHEDATFTTTWAIDLHFEDSLNAARFPSGAFKTQTVHRWIYPYALPYRTLYSRNVDNLFMAGRNISVTHVALGTVRVMRTTGMMGEVVGMAASLCKKYNVMPRDIYRLHIPELQSLMREGVGRKDLPNNQRFNEPNENLPAPRGLKSK